MSESMNARIANGDFRHQLLTTVCTLALLVSVCDARKAEADDTSQPLVWISVGGAFDTLNGGQNTFLAPFELVAPRPAFEVVSPQDLQHSPRLGWDADTEITFQPEGSSWVFSASARYGRAIRAKESDQQPPPVAYTYFGFAYGPYGFAAGATRNTETHAILDFKVGKDVGLGMFGPGGSSVFALGVRYAVFNSLTDTHWSSHPTNLYSGKFFHGTAELARKFSGIGPSLSWNGSAPVWGNAQAAGSISFDLDATAAFLFGRQKVSGSHQTNEHIHPFRQPFYSVYARTLPITRDRAVGVPSFGGSAAITYRLQNVRFSFGYRADVFLRVIDGGVDSRASFDRGFYGPFAKISIGVGG